MDKGSVKILADDEVEKDSTYRQLVNQLFLTLNITDTETAQKTYPGLLQLLSDIYYNVRSRIGCNNNNAMEEDMYDLLPQHIKKEFSLEKQGCDRDITLRLLVALSKRKNISWESVGDKDQSWLLEPLKRIGYSIHIRYVGAPLEILQERIHKRAQSSLDNLTSKYQLGIRLVNTDLQDRMHAIVAQMPIFESNADKVEYYDTNKVKPSISRNDYITLLTATN